MRLIAITFIFFGILFNSCNTHNLNSELQDIWIGDYKQTIYFDNAESMFVPLPTLIDLTESSNAIIKNFDGKEINTSWGLIDSILTLDSIKYRIISVTKDSITYSPYLTENIKPKEKPFQEDIIVAVPVKDCYYVLKRIKKKKTNLSSDQITQILNNSLCYSSTNNSEITKYGEKIEFFDNGVSISKVVDSSGKTNLQEDLWKIEEYKGYSFLVFYVNLLQNNGFMTSAYQILDIDKSEFTLDGFIQGSMKYQIEKIDEKHSDKQKMIGMWFSINDTAEYYNRFIPKRGLKEGRIKLYNDTLIYKFCMDSLIISGNGFLPLKCNWRLNSDNTFLIYEFPINYKEFTGFHVEYANITRQTESNFSLELFDNSIETGYTKPQIIILNRNQEFIKLK